MWLPDLIQDYGYLALFIGTFMEGETILVLAGLAAHQGYLELKWVFPVAFIGTFISDQLFFHLGHKKGRQFVMSRPKWKRRAERIQPLLDKYQTLIVIGFRYFYGLRNIVPVLIGTTGFPPLRFFVLNFIGAWLWAVTVGYAGYLFGEAIEAVIKDVRKYELWILTGVAVVGLLIWIYHIVRSRRQLAAASDPNSPLPIVDTVPRGPAQPLHSET
jgi:membrane protein DedA with SNARE-associated domain